VRLLYVMYSAFLVHYSTHSVSRVVLALLVVLIRLLTFVMHALLCTRCCCATQVSKRVQEPILAYTEATAEVNALQWSASHPEWIAIAFANKMQILHV
jgi:hypothetical protein